MIVRPATTDDVDALAVVHGRTWQMAYREEVPQEYFDRLDLAQRREGWLQRLQSEQPPAGTLVLEHQVDGVIGFINVAPSRDVDTDPGSVGEVKAVYVLPEYWGNGAGQILMEAGLRRLQEAGYSDVVLWVLESNRRARRFYEAGGWRNDGTSKIDESRGFPLVVVRYRYHTAALGT